MHRRTTPGALAAKHRCPPRLPPESHATLREIFDHVTSHFPGKASPTTITVLGRKLDIPMAKAGTAMVDFASLCHEVTFFTLGAGHGPAW